MPILDWREVGAGLPGLRLFARVNHDGSDEGGVRGHDLPDADLDWGAFDLVGNVGKIVCTFEVSHSGFASFVLLRGGFVLLTAALQRLARNRHLMKEKIIEMIDLGLT